jgi:thiamine biosynthesis lipoprotein
MLLNAAGVAETEQGFPVGEITWGCLHVARDLAQATQGAFDPTMQPLVALWGFGKERDIPLPTETQIESALAATGWEKFSVSFESSVVYKQEAVQLDLSAVAKGCAADSLAELAIELGCSGGLIEVGGEIRVFGERAEGGPWRVGVEAPASRPDATLPTCCFKP